MTPAATTLCQAITAGAELTAGRRASSKVPATSDAIAPTGSRYAHAGALEIRRSAPSARAVPANAATSAATATGNPQFDRADRRNQVADHRQQPHGGLVPEFRAAQPAQQREPDERQHREAPAQQGRCRCHVGSQPGSHEAGRPGKDEARLQRDDADPHGMSARTVARAAS
jgi:hypothetical protein